jgi:hypothetical protein
MVLNQGLKHNSTVLGIHMTGNEIDTDPQGFLTDEHITGKEKLSHTVKGYEDFLHSALEKDKPIQTHRDHQFYINSGA